MEIFLAIWNNWSLYQKITLSVMFILLFIIIVLLVRFSTKSKPFTIFTILSLVISACITVLGFLILNIVFDTTITYLYLLTPILVLIINILNISTSIGFYTKQKQKKEIDIVTLKKEFLRDSLQLSIFITILFSAFSMFLTGTSLTFILLTGGISVIMPWINYALIYWIFKKNA